MAVRTRFIKGKGMVDQKVTSGENTVNLDEAVVQGVGPGVLETTAHTAAATLTANDAGMHTVSGAAALTLTLPDPANVPGARYTFRSLSAHAHVITGSATNQSPSFVGIASGSGVQVALENIVGASAVVESDGLQYIVLAGRGSPTYS